MTTTSRIQLWKTGYVCRLENMPLSLCWHLFVLGSPRLSNICNKPQWCQNNMYMLTICKQHNMTSDASTQVRSWWHITYSIICPFLCMPMFLPMSKKKVINLKLMTKHFFNRHKGQKISIQQSSECIVRRIFWNFNLCCATKRLKKINLVCMVMYTSLLIYSF